MIFSAAGLIISILPMVQVLIMRFQGLAVKISGDFSLLFAVGVLLNAGTWTAAWKKRNK